MDEAARRRLAQVREAAHEAGGDISVTSAPGGGTAVEIVFPQAPGRPASP